MDIAKATSLLQLGLYPLAGFAGERSGLMVKRIVCNVLACELSIVELTDGKIGLLWPAHGELHTSLDGLRELCKRGLRTGNNEVVSPLNHHEYTRLEFACE